MAEDRGTCFHEASYIDETDRRRTTKVPVVQELARRSVKNIPARFLWTHPNYKSLSSVCEIDPISDLFPSINMAQLRAGSDPECRALELQKLAGGAKKWGAFTIVDHGISPDVLQAVRAAVKGFFELSFEEKKASVGSYASVDNIGYGRNFVKSEDQPLDWIDRLTIKVVPSTATEGLRVWPQRPSNFREAIEKYVEEARSTLNILLELLAESMSLPEQAFLRHFHSDDSEINLRVNYYPPSPSPDLTLGLVPHTDGSVLTLLLQFGAAGALQLLKDQRWVAVPWPGEALLVVAGDFLEIMSNGRVESPWHRAATLSDVERFSVALFYNPPSWAEIEPAAAAEGSEHGGYKKVVVRDYLQHLYKISPTPEKEAIKFAKV